MKSLDGMKDSLAIQERERIRESARRRLLNDVRYVLWPTVALGLAVIYCLS